MPRQSEPDMRDKTDEEVHRKEGVDPYPIPKRTETVERTAADTEDPALTDADTHDRGTAVDGHYTDATDARKEALKDGGDYDAWKHGRTQETPPRRRH